MAGKNGGKAAPAKAAKAALAQKAADDAGLVSGKAPDLAVSDAGARAAGTEAHMRATPDKPVSLPGVPDTVSQILGPVATSPVIKGEALTYRVKERSYIPRKPGDQPVLVEAGETIVYDGKPGSNLELVKPARKAAAEA